MDSENKLLLPTSNVSILSYKQKAQGSTFNLYRGQTSKVYPIWMNMVSYHLSCNSQSFKKGRYQMLYYHNYNNKAKYIEFNQCQWDSISNLFCVRPTMTTKYLMYSKLFFFWKSVGRQIIWDHFRVHFLCECDPCRDKMLPLTFLLIKTE